MRVVQEGLRWNAADVQAGATECVVLLDAVGIEAHLSCFDGGDVASWSTSDHYDVSFMLARVEATEGASRYAQR